MFGNRGQILRVGLGLLATVLVVALLDRITWYFGDPPYKISGQYYLWLAMIEPTSLAIGTAVGAYLARTKFLIPSIGTGVLICVLSDSFFDMFIRAAECGLFTGTDIKVMVLILAVGGSIFGALFGGRLYDRSIKVAP